VNKPQNITSERIETLQHALQVMTTCRDHWKTSYEERNAELEQAKADNAALVAAIDDVYPMVAGRAMSLLGDGEEKAGQQWNEAAQKLYRATQDRPGAAPLEDLKQYKRALELACKINSDLFQTWGEAMEYCLSQAKEDSTNA